MNYIRGGEVVRWWFANYLRVENIFHPNRNVDDFVGCRLVEVDEVIDDDYRYYDTVIFV